MRRLGEHLSPIHEEQRRLRAREHLALQKKRAAALGERSGVDVADPLFGPRDSMDAVTELERREYDNPLPVEVDGQWLLPCDLGHGRMCDGRAHFARRYGSTTERWYWSVYEFCKIQKAIWAAEAEERAEKKERRQDGGREWGEEK